MGLTPASIGALQSRIGNQAVTQMVQRMQTSYVPVASAASARPAPLTPAVAIQRAAYGINKGTKDIADGSRVTIEEDKAEVTIASEAKGVSGMLEWTPKTVPENALKADGSAATRVRVWNIDGFEADPKGHKLGQLMAYHMATMAEAAGITYIVAGKITTAAIEPFYIPLGFQEFIGGPSWNAFKQQQHGSDEEKRAAISAFAEAFNMYIATGTLKANAATAWGRVWAPVVAAAAPQAEEEAPPPPPDEEEAPPPVPDEEEAPPPPPEE